MMNRVLFSLQESSWVSIPLRHKLLSRTGMSLGPGVEILPSTRFAGPTVEIGAKSFLNQRCLYDGGAPLTIGAECAIGYNVTFCTITHELGDEHHRAGPELKKPIVIGDGCWIGANALILPGVTIGNGCVIAAGSVVNRDCEPNSTYAGVPAKRLGPVKEPEAA